jgi:putrescine aminotransferase
MRQCRRPKPTKWSCSKDLKLGPRLFDAGYRNGLTFRAFADNILGFAPPLCITTDEVDCLVGRLRQTPDSILDVKELRA